MDPRRRYAVDQEMYAKAIRTCCSGSDVTERRASCGRVVRYVMSGSRVVEEVAPWEQSRSSQQQQHKTRLCLSLSGILTTISFSGSSDLCRVFCSVLNFILSACSLLYFKTQTAHLT